MVRLIGEDDSRLGREQGERAKYRVLLALDVLDREGEGADEELPHEEEGREEERVDDESEEPRPRARRDRVNALHEAASKPNSASSP